MRAVLLALPSRPAHLLLSRRAFGAALEYPLDFPFMSSTAIA
jgi:hypothetical protein